jgi:hypothetical protein
MKCLQSILPGVNGSPIGVVITAFDKIHNSSRKKAVEDSIEHYIHDRTKFGGHFYRSIHDDTASITVIFDLNTDTVKKSEIEVEEIVIT